MGNINYFSILKHGLQANYDALVESGKVDENVLYFCTDTRRIYKGGHNFSRPVDFDELKNDVYQVTSDSINIAELAKDITPKAGDVLIVTNSLGIKSAYSYDTEDGWVACSGNVSADNVILTEDITMAGNYTQVGNLTKTTNGTATFSTAGKSVSAALLEIFSKRLQPKITSQPKVTFSTDITNDVEVGTTVTPTFVATFDDGAYTYESTTGVSVTAWEVTDSAGNTAITSNSGSFPAFVVGDDTSYTVTAKATHTAGNVAKDNLGSPSDPTIQIASGSKSTTSGSITGYRKMFFGCKTVLDTELTSDKIRALTGTKTSTGTFNLTIPEGTVQVIIAVPKARTLSKVADTGAFGTDIVASFNNNKSSLDVEGANDYDAAEYTIYQYTPDAALGANTYEVTIA